MNSPMPYSLPPLSEIPNPSFCQLTLTETFLYRSLTYGLLERGVTSKTSTHWKIVCI